ncbi:MAG: hypothetical protein IJ809_00865 [Clostridia bacterium]|nr:hypothetical protein [Clostridia bacterium]
MTKVKTFFSKVVDKINEFEGFVYKNLEKKDIRLSATKSWVSVILVQPVMVIITDNFDIWVRFAIACTISLVTFFVLFYLNLYKAAKANDEKEKLQELNGKIYRITKDLDCAKHFITKYEYEISDLTARIDKLEKQLKS